MLHEVLIAVFLTVTTPVTLMLLGRAALYRDRSENAADLLPPIRTDGERACRKEEPPFIRLARRHWQVTSEVS